MVLVKSEISPNFVINSMLKNLFKKKQPLHLINAHEADVALRLMFEIAISDGKLDSSELNLIKNIVQREKTSFQCPLQGGLITSSPYFVSTADKCPLMIAAFAARAAAFFDK